MCGEIHEQSKTLADRQVRTHAHITGHIKSLKSSGFISQNSLAHLRSLGALGRIFFPISRRKWTMDKEISNLARLEPYT